MRAIDFRLIIRRAVWLYLRFILSYHDAEDLLAERGLRRQSASVVLRKIYREAFEIGEGAVSQSSLMRGAQDHTRRLVLLERFLPARCT